MQGHTYKSCTNFPFILHQYSMFFNSYAKILFILISTLIQLQHFASVSSSMVSSFRISSSPIPPGSKCGIGIQNLPLVKVSEVFYFFQQKSIFSANNKSVGKVNSQPIVESTSA